MPRSWVLSPRKFATRSHLGRIQPRESSSIGGPLDGELHPAPRPEGAMTAYTRVSSRILESTLVVDDAVVAVARRQVSEDGQLMAVLQQNLSPDGDEVRITQVYRRAH